MFKPKLKFILFITLALFCFLMFYLNNTLKQNNIQLDNLQKSINTSTEIIETNTRNIPDLESQINDLVYHGEKVNIVQPVYRGEKTRIITLK